MEDRIDLDNSRYWTRICVRCSIGLYPGTAYIQLHNFIFCERDAGLDGVTTGPVSGRWYNRREDGLAGTRRKRSKCISRIVSSGRVSRFRQSTNIEDLRRRYVRCLGQDESVDRGFECLVSCCYCYDNTVIKYESGSSSCHESVLMTKVNTDEVGFEA